MTPAEIVRAKDILVEREELKEKSSRLSMKEDVLAAELAQKCFGIVPECEITFSEGRRRTRGIVKCIRGQVARQYTGGATSTEPDHINITLVVSILKKDGSPSVRGCTTITLGGWNQVEKVERKVKK